MSGRGREARRVSLSYPTAAFSSLHLRGVNRVIAMNHVGIDGAEKKEGDLYVMSGGRDGTVRRWSANEREKTVTADGVWSGHCHWVNDIVFCDPKEEFFASCSSGISLNSFHSLTYLFSSLILYVHHSIMLLYVFINVVCIYLCIY
jgi:WD40 repeat protein